MRLSLGVSLAAAALAVVAGAAAHGSATNGRIGYLRPLGGNEPPYSRLFVVEPDGGGAADLTPPGYTDIRSFAWSPDGRRVAFSAIQDGDSDPELFVMNADGTGQRRLTNAFGNCDSPAWSPRGTLIAFHCAMAAEKVSVMRPDGTRIRVLLPRADTIEGRPAWSPDGRTLAFGRGLRGPSWAGLGIWTIRPDGRGLHRILAAGGSPAFSPDGRWLAFVLSRDGNQELWKAPADGRGDPVQLTSTYGITESAPAWRRAP